MDEEGQKIWEVVVWSQADDGGLGSESLELMIRGDDLREVVASAMAVCEFYDRIYKGYSHTIQSIGPA